jgi:type IV pilus assembly protein PilA
MARLRPSNEYGYTIIEVTVVMLVIGILVGIAIPTFLGFRGRAQDTAAKQSAVLAVKGALGAGDGDMFEGVTTDALNDSEPSLTFVDADDLSTSFTVVSQVLLASDIFVAAVRSVSGTCFMIRHQEAGSDFAKADVPTCKAEDYALMAFGPSW